MAEVAKPDIKISPMILEGQYAPRVHVIGEDSLVQADFRGFGYRVMPNENSKDFSYGDTDIAVFTGGSDIHPKFYGEPFSGANRPIIKRDEEEIDWFHLYEDIPKVGICRGMQLLNILNGGKLVQHVSGHNTHHRIKDKWGFEVTSSSVHHQVCIPANGSQVLAWSDGISGEGIKDPEVMVFPDCKGFGVQGHPEYGPDNFRHYFFLLMKFIVLPWVQKPKVVVH